MTDQIELADVVSFIRCHLAGDERTCREMLATMDPVVLLSLVISTALEIAATALPGGKAELVDMVEDWQVRRRDSLLD